MDKKTLIKSGIALSHVVCQIKFPSILLINNNLSDEFIRFHECLRLDFPLDYKIDDVTENEIQINPNESTPQFSQQKIRVYSFFDLEQKYVLNLSSSYISLSTNKYDSWENFTGVFIKAINSFFTIYKPVLLNRIGLRYINGFNEKKFLIKTQSDWKEILDSKILGFLVDDDCKINSTSLTTELSLDNNKYIRLISVLGQIKDENEKSMILDIDAFDQNIKRLKDLDATNYSREILDQLHEVIKLYFSKMTMTME